MLVCLACVVRLRRTGQKNNPSGKYYGARPCRFGASNTVSYNRGGRPMTVIDRRRFIQLSGVGAATAATGGLAGILASGRAPAFAQGTTLHWVRGPDYVPVSDQTMRTKINEQAQKDLGIKINL